MGLNITEPFDTSGMDSRRILTKIEEFSGRKVIREANKPYSGTAVIDDFWTTSDGNWRVDYLYFS